MKLLAIAVCALSSFFIVDALREPQALLYLNLMKKCLTNSIYEDTPIATFNDDGSPREVDLQKIQYDNQAREQGQDHPSIAHTMIGIKRLNNIQECIEDILENNVPGDLIETGVWRGGATIFMRSLLKIYNITNRLVWVADSFAGLPVPNIKDYPQDKGLDLYTIPFLAVSLETVQANFSKYNLLDEQVRFLKGWFKDTLPTASIKQLALMRLDGDLYESTMDALTNLYPKLSVGGYVIIDDFHIEACRQAVRDYRAKHTITDEIKKIDNNAVFWKRMR